MYKLTVGVIFAATLSVIVYFSFGEKVRLLHEKEVQTSDVKELIERFQDYTPPTIEFCKPNLDKPLKTYKKRVYVVQSGDTLQGIALRFYGNPGKWHGIVEANEHVLLNAEMITVGMQLVIPY